MHLPLQSHLKAFCGSIPLGRNCIGRFHLLVICKQRYKLWTDSYKLDENLRKDNILAERNLRKQLRKEKFDDRKNFYEDLMSNSTIIRFLFTVVSWLPVPLVKQVTGPRATTDR